VAHLGAGPSGAMSAAGESRQTTVEQAIPRWRHCERGNGRRSSFALAAVVFAAGEARPWRKALNHI
jgi:hypothetical protein